MRTILLVYVAIAVAVGCARTAAPSAERVVITNEGWNLVGDLVRPTASPREDAPAVLLLNGAGRDRTAYESLAQRLAALGIASLRLDLRAMGESINLGRFIPYDSTGHNDTIGFQRSWSDVQAAFAWLAAQPGIDARRLGGVGASYSGEALALAIQGGGGPIAVVALTPGSFSDSSLARVDGDGRSWFFVYATREITVREWQMDQWTRRGSTRARVVVVRDSAHATDLLQLTPEMVGRLAEWFSRSLGVEAADDRWARAADRVAAGIAPGDDDLRQAGATTPSLAHGLAGRLRFLAAWHQVRAKPESREAVRRAAEQVAASSGPWPAESSLYSGRIGAALALVDAADALGDTTLRRMARQEVARLRASVLPQTSGIRWSGADDVLTGNAGTMLALWALWRQLDDTTARQLAFDAGRALVARGRVEGEGRYWLWRDGADLNLPNFSHGTAGIAAALAMVSRDPTAPAELLEAAVAGGRYLRDIATVDARGMRVPYGWPIPEGGWDRPFDVSWAHGQAGTARLFWELWNATRDSVQRNAVVALVTGLDSADLDTAAPGDATVPYNFGYRFGLTGIADLYADLYDVTGNRRYLERAVALAERIVAVADSGEALLWTRPQPAFTSNPGAPSTPTGFLHGAAGPGMLFLKLDALLHGRRPPQALPDSPFDMP